MKKSEALKALGLSEGASDEDVKKAHRKLVIENHPDRFANDPAAQARAEERTKQINEARDVLLNRSWDPEYGTAGTPYGAPFSYNPYAAAGGRPDGGATGRPAGNRTTSSGTGDPFAGWPFSESFVWTTWDADGHRTTYSASGTDPFAARDGSAQPGYDPFDAFRATGTGNPFASGFHYTGDPFADLFNAFIPREPTVEEKLAEAKRDLTFDGKLIAVKLALLAVCCLLSAPATGLYLYTIVSIGQGVWKRLSFLSLVFLVPFAMLAIIFSPGGDAAIGIFALIVFAIAVGFDISNVYRHAQRIRELKMQMGN